MSIPLSVWQSITHSKKMPTGQKLQNGTNFAEFCWIYLNTLEFLWIRSFWELRDQWTDGLDWRKKPLIHLHFATKWCRVERFLSLSLIEKPSSNWNVLFISMESTLTSINAGRKEKRTGTKEGRKEGRKEERKEGSKKVSRKEWWGKKRERRKEEWEDVWKKEWNKER